MKVKTVILIVTVFISIISIAAINSYADNREKEFIESQPYVLKIYNNNVAVYKNDKIIEIFDTVNYSALPEYDRNQLKKGMSFDSIEEIYSVIEDFDG